MTKKGEPMQKTTFTFIITIIVSLSSSLFSQDCENALEDALEYFGQQRYNMIVALFIDCPPGQLPDKTQQIMSYELLAQAYFFNSQADSVKGILNRLLDLQPDYTVQPPQYAADYISMVEELRDERARLESRSIFRNKWFWIGGVAVTSVTTYFILSKKSASEVLPDAPDPPVIR